MDEQQNGEREVQLYITYYFTTHTCVLVWQLQYSHLLIFHWLQSTSCVVQRVGGLHAERLWTSKEATSTVYVQC